MLAAKTVLLVRKMLVDTFMPSGLRAMSLHMLLMNLEPLLVHLAQLMHGHLQIANKCITSAAREILSHHDSHQLHGVAMRCHGVSWNNPTAFTKLMCYGELVELVAVLWVEAESNEWETFAMCFGEQCEAHLLHGFREVVCCPGQVEHDAAVALSAETDELIVLGDDLRCATGEIECERRLIGTEVVDVEDEFCARYVSNDACD